MDMTLIITCAGLLSIERICYAWAWLDARSFRSFCSSAPMAPHGEPTEVLERLFYAFKVLQVSVFIFWCLALGDGQLWPPPAHPAAILLGVGAIGVGQILNFLVFVKLGRSGVFYGIRFGHDIPWVDAFPFSLIKHPQYVGAALSVWGFFLVMRFPQDDWIVLPVIQTLYYVLGAYSEQA
jgi:phosphatidyl-N-methylethanolamine N-methyltransferase